MNGGLREEERERELMNRMCTGALMHVHMHTYIHTCRTLVYLFVHCTTCYNTSYYNNTNVYTHHIN